MGRTDEKSRTWSIPGSRTKNKKAHIVHLSEPAWQVIAQRPVGSYLFGTSGAKHFQAYSTSKRALDTLSGITGCRPHDRRRTIVSGMARLGVPPHVADKILNHQAGTISGVAAVYQRHLSGIVALKGIEAGAGAITVGAMTRHVDVANSPAVANSIPALAQLAGGIGDPAVRNRGTIGGSLANNDPAADYPAAVLALGATVMTEQTGDPGRAVLPRHVRDCAGAGRVDHCGEISLPIAAGYAKMPNAASRFALVGVFVAKFATGVRVAVTGAGPAVFSRSGAQIRALGQLSVGRRQRPWRRSGGIQFGHSC